MAITQAICTNFKKELLEAAHNFKTSGGHTFFMALYPSAATLGASNAIYTATGESSGTGYSAGGKALVRAAAQPSIVGTTGITDFDDLTWATSSITAGGAMIYNTTTTPTNAAVAVLSFGSDKTSSAGDFTVIFPAPDATNAIIRIA